MAYLHGTYGEIGNSKIAEAVQSNSIAAYVGTAPINLIRGWKEKDLLNTPIKLTNMSEVENTVGYSNNWKDFSLCEAFAAHFDNTVSNIGPIYIINTLDPELHVKAEATNQMLKFVNKRAEIKSQTMILDTFAIEDKVEGLDYSIYYNFSKESLIITALTELDEIDASFLEVDSAKVTVDEIIGIATVDGEYSGIGALSLLYQRYGEVINILSAPGWSNKKEVYIAMTDVVQNLNGHWHGIVNADIPIEGVDTIEKCQKWKEENGYSSEFSKIYWPMVRDEKNRIFHLSTIATVTMLRIDLLNDSIPYESPSNKEIMGVSLYFGENSKNRGFDSTGGNKLNEKGITTAIFRGGSWVLWGPHTAAYKYDNEQDQRSIFDSNIRMLMYLTNKFQIDHGSRIDSPLSPQDVDSIVNFEQAKLDSLAGRGILIGNPKVSFLESANPVPSMMNGDFSWDISVTNTPPFKSGGVRVSYTDEGFSSYYGRGE